MANERNTEKLFRQFLTEKGYYTNPKITIEEQKSNLKKIKNLLKESSKQGTKKVGFPEYIITKKNSDTIILVECKSSVKDHKSPIFFKADDYDSISKYASDGVVHYMSFLKNEFNVIGIALSGEDEKDYKMSGYIWKKGEASFSELPSVNQIDTFDGYQSLFKETINFLKDDEVLKLAKKLNDYMYKSMTLSLEHRPPLITAIILALLNPAFKKSYLDYSTSKEVIDELLNAAKKTLKSKGYTEENIKIVLSNFKFNVEKSLTSEELIDKNSPEDTPILYLINEIRENIIRNIEANTNLDIIGIFYTEFLRYINGDKGELGIVLTPKHITELFTDLARISPSDKVIDICAGSGGFLISAINKMLSQVSLSTDIDRVKNSSAIGVELQPKMYSLLLSNMLVRGNYDMNLFYGSCFDFESQIKALKPNKALVNPPYSQADSELKFISYSLDLLVSGGIGVFIVPKSTMFKMNKSDMEFREKILSKHKLVGVMSMNEKLFYPTSTSVVICVFETGKPHLDAAKKPVEKTWFADWSEDGHEIKKDKGRKDMGQWATIKAKWLEDFNDKTVGDKSILRKVGLEDEWLYEAYSKPDYSELSEFDFKKVIFDYLEFEVNTSGHE